MTNTDRQDRIWMCTVVFLDIVGFTQRSMTRQANVKSRLEELIWSAVADIHETDLVIVDTGDGAALCHVGDPEEALFIGVRKDKHGKSHDVYELLVAQDVRAATTRLTRTITGQASVAASSAPAAPVELVVSDVETQQLAQELAAYIGPLAAVLVKKAVSRASDITTLHQMLAEMLPAGAARQQFLAARGLK